MESGADRTRAGDDLRLASPDDFRRAYLAAPPVELGAGSRAAVLVVDFARGWTDPASPLALPLDRELDAAAELLRAARSAGAPITFTTVAFPEGTEDRVLLALKAPRVTWMRPGTPWVEIDPRLEANEGERVIVKQQASAFFGTGLAEHLTTAGVDTLLVCGCVTSGCVRASVVDAAQHGFRPLVVREAVGDRSPLAHEANLLDIEARYGDVVSVTDALALLTRRQPA